MKELGVDLYITAPQKGWSAPACVGVVMLGDLAVQKLADTKSSSFSLDLKKWIDLSNAYENGGFMYHCTPPTDAIMTFRDAVKETKEFGYENAKNAAIE